MASLHLPSTSCRSVPSLSFSDQSHILFYSRASASSSSSSFPFLSTASRRRLSSFSSSLRHGPHRSSSSSSPRASSVITDPCPIDKDQESILQELADLKSQMKKKKKELKTLTKKKEKEEEKKKMLMKKEKAGDCESSSSSSDEEECCDQTVNIQELKKELGFSESAEAVEETSEATGFVQTMEEKAFKLEIKQMKEKAKSEKKKLMRKKTEGKKDCESSTSSSSCSESTDDEKDCRDQFVALKTLKKGSGFVETMPEAKENTDFVQSVETSIKELPFSNGSMEMAKALSSSITESVVTAKTSPCSNAKAFLYHTEAVERGKVSSSCTEFMDPLSYTVAEGSMGTPRLTGEVQVCVGGKCKRAGSEKLMASLRSHIPANSGVETIPCKCMGKCDMAINVKVKKLDEETSTQIARHSYVGADDANLILSHHFGLGTEMAPPPAAAALP